MGKVKIKRKSTLIDMTAMSDVLLLVALGHAHAEQIGQMGKGGTEHVCLAERCFLGCVQSNRVVLVLFVVDGYGLVKHHAAIKERVRSST